MKEFNVSSKGNSDKKNDGKNFKILLKSTGWRHAPDRTWRPSVGWKRGIDARWQRSPVNAEANWRVARGTRALTPAAGCCRYVGNAGGRMARPAGCVADQSDAVESCAGTAPGAGPAMPCTGRPWSCRLLCSAAHPRRACREDQRVVIGHTCSRSHSVGISRRTRQCDQSPGPGSFQS